MSQTTTITMDEETTDFIQALKRLPPERRTFFLGAVKFADFVESENKERICYGEKKRTAN